MVENLSSSTENLGNSKIELYELKKSIENDLSDNEYLQECEKVLLDNWINVNNSSEEELEQALNEYRNYLSEPNPNDAGWWVLVLMWLRFVALAYLYKIRNKTWKDLASKKNTYPWIFSLQIALNELWYKIPRDDWFFWQHTEKAIKKFQADNKIKVDWAPGRKTINKIIVRTIKQLKADQKKD